MPRRTVVDSDDLCYLEHEGIIRETPDAKLFAIHGEEVWLPKSQIKDEGDELVAIPLWLAQKRGLESDW